MNNHQSRPWYCVCEGCERHTTLVFDREMFAAVCLRCKADPPEKLISSVLARRAGFLVETGQ